MTRRTAFFTDERCFWHFGGHHILTIPVGGLVQPSASATLAESPETKRRLRNLMEVTGLIGHLDTRSAEPASEEELRRVHTRRYLDEFKRHSDAGGGEFYPASPFGKGGYEIAAVSAGLARQAVADVMKGLCRNAYALTRPPGHHCLPDQPMGFCLLANIPVAIEAAKSAGLLERVAVVDWDVHHGNGTEAIYYERADVLTISLHQENNFPRPGGDFADRGRGAGEGFNINVPLLPGAGHDAYAHAFARIVEPAVRRFRPDLIVVACGYDASGVDPLSRTLAHSETYRLMTTSVMALAADLCGERLALMHEGGYSEVHVPFCGHRTIETLASVETGIADPVLPRIAAQQPNARFVVFQNGLIDEMADALGLA
ncbi:MAG: class II histone deacetylase [Hyphomicrobiaceae bacterium]